MRLVIGSTIKEPNNSDPGELTRTLAIGVHDSLLHPGCGLSNSDHRREKQLFCPAHTPEDFSTDGRTEAFRLKLPDPESPIERPFRDAYGPLGALTALTFGYGPVDLEELFSDRRIYSRRERPATDGAILEPGPCQIFSDGVTEKTATKLHFPARVIDAGFTRCTLSFPQQTLSTLMTTGTLRGAKIPVHLHKTPDGDSLVQAPGTPPRVGAEYFGDLHIQRISRARIAYTVQPYGEWHDTNQKWIRDKEIAPLLAGIIEQGTGYLPNIDPITIPKSRKVAFAGHTFPITDRYKQEMINLEFYLAPAQGGEPPKLLATFWPEHNYHDVNKEVLPVQIYPTAVGKQPDEKKRIWTPVTIKAWQAMQQIRNNLTRCSA